MSRGVVPGNVVMEGCLVISVLGGVLGTAAEVDSPD